MRALPHREVVVAIERVRPARVDRVRLCRGAVEILDAAWSLGNGDGRLVFTVHDGERREEKVLRRLLDRANASRFPADIRSAL